MRKSRNVTLTLMAGLAAACSDGRVRSDTSAAGVAALPLDDQRRCVDEQNRVVGDDECARPRGAGFYPYAYYYGGRAYSQGGATYVSGGRRVAVRGAPVYAPSQRGPVSRGGLGAIGAGRSGSFGG